MKDVSNVVILYKCFIFYHLDHNSQTKFYIFRVMEGLYHQTNALLEQTQGYFVRLEQVLTNQRSVSPTLLTIDQSQDRLEQNDVERLQSEIQSRLETMWSNSERLDMLAAKVRLGAHECAVPRH